MSTPGKKGKSFPVWIDRDFYVNKEVIWDEDTKLYRVWDPWYNRMLRWIFGGFYKKLREI